jgi:predicted DNA-binding ribbon-helix-helix protein
MLAPSPVKKRSICLRGKDTSLSLEPEFWTGLWNVAGKRGLHLYQLVEQIDQERTHANLCSAIRVAVLRFYRDRQ